MDGQLYAVRSWIYRLGTKNFATHRQPVRLEVVTYVLGTKCYRCLESEQLRSGAGERSRTLDLRITSALLYQLSYTGTVGFE